MFNNALVVVLACAVSIFVVLVQGQEDTCARRRRHDCLPDVSNKSTCPPQCNKCSSDFPLPRLCQTVHRACIFGNRQVLSQFLTKTSCESNEGRVWCGGDDLQQCVETQPILEACFNGIDSLTFCAEHSDVQSCHQNGCFWCDVGRQFTKGKCFKRDRSIGCGSETCCFEEKCLPGDVTEQECSSRSCLICNDGTRNRCNFAGNDSSVIDESKWSECTRECGGGTQFRLKNCNNGSESCETEFRSCNEEECELPQGYCAFGVRARYNDGKLCCANHTYACGRNALNENIDRNLHRRVKRVVGGVDVTDEFRWHWVGVIYLDTSKAATSRKCTGTLISDSWLITSTKCLGPSNVSDTVVHLGTPNRAMRPKHRSLVTRTVGQQFVSLIQLSTPVPAEGVYISPICMPNSEEPLSDRRCVVTGWGRSGPDTACTATLQEGNIRVLPWKLCVDAWKPELEGLNGSQHICAGVPEGEIDACTGDHGGPLMCQRCSNCGWYLAGIATEHLGCGVMGKPSVYTKTTGNVEQFVGDYVAALDTATYSSCPPL